MTALHNMQGASTMESQGSSWFLFSACLHRSLMSGPRVPPSLLNLGVASTALPSYLGGGGVGRFPPPCPQLPPKLRFSPSSPAWGLSQLCHTAMPIPAFGAPGSKPWSTNSPWPVPRGTWYPQRQWDRTWMTRNARACSSWFPSQPSAHTAPRYLDLTVWEFIYTFPKCLRKKPKQSHNKKTKKHLQVT